MQLIVRQSVHEHVSGGSCSWLSRLPSGISTDIGADRGCQQVVDGSGSGSSVEKQSCSRRRTTATEAVTSDKKTVTVEPVGSNKSSAAAANARNWQGTARLSSGPASAKQGDDSVDSDNISSSVSLQLHKGGKHPGICTNS